MNRRPNVGPGFALGVCMCLLASSTWAFSPVGTYISSPIQSRYYGTKTGTIPINVIVQTDPGEAFNATYAAQSKVQITFLPGPGSVVLPSGRQTYAMPNFKSWIQDSDLGAMPPGTTGFRSRGLCPHAAPTWAALPVRDAQRP